MVEENDFYKDLIDNLYDGIYFVNRDRVITYWNKGAERITGYSGERVLGRACRNNVLNHVSVDGVQMCRDHCPLAACMEDGNARETEAFLHHADGHRVPVLIRAAPLRNEAGEIIGAVETFSGDTAITVRHELRELRQTAQTDALTGVRNRRYLEGRLRAVLTEVGQQNGVAAGLLFMDIDHFKQVNDTYGHEVGDQALRMVAATLRDNLRKSDILGRWGCEEFLVILYDVTTQEAVKSIAEKLRMLVEFSRLDLESASLGVTISIGATMLLSDDTLETAVRRADELMYQSKQAGRNRVSVG